MHRTLKQETAQPAAANRRAQQRAFDRFREEYNEQRPHEALGMQTPALVYEPSPRAYPARVPEPDYPANMLVRSVQHQGQIRRKKHDVVLSQVLRGERVGLLPVDERWFTVYFAQFPIARFDSRKLRVLPLPQEENYDMAEAEVPFPCTPSPQRGGRKTVRDVPGLNCQGCPRPFKRRDFSLALLALLETDSKYFR